jgi:Helix-turn-helix of insertion element transposase
LHEGSYIMSKGEEMQELLLVTHGGKEIDLKHLPEPQSKGTKGLPDTHRKLALLQATLPYHKLTFKEQCDLVGFSRQSGYKALQKKEFQEYVEEILDQQNRQFMGTVFSKLQGIIENSRSERMQLEGIKIYLQLTGKLQEVKEVTHTVKHELPTQEERERVIIEMEKELLEVDDV